jgi:hypothetical protein
MKQHESLGFLGKPDVRNAILLSEIGVLVHDLGKVSAEFVAGEPTFHSHLVLRRLTRGKDAYLGCDPGPWSAVVHVLRTVSFVPEDRAVADAISSEMVERRFGGSAGPDYGVEALEAVLGRARARPPVDGEAAFERVAGLARRTWLDFVWQVEQEEAIGAMEPPFVGVDGFYEQLDQLPAVADLLEMGGRTWHPEEMQPPEARLLQAIHGGERAAGPPSSRCAPQRLADVRRLWCEVLVNQFLEINNIRKDGPGDLGSWFWKSRLDAGRDAATALLGEHGPLPTLDDEQRDALKWLGVRVISRWACSKIVLGARANGGPVSLWNHCSTLAALHKSSTAQALLSGSWPDAHQLSWRRLRVGIRRASAAEVTRIKELVEVEYPLGNELMRTDAEAHFSFPGLDGRSAANLLGELGVELRGLLGKNESLEMQLSPLSKQEAGLLVGRSVC